MPAARTDQLLAAARQSVYPQRMQITGQHSDLYIPDAAPLATALGRCTQLGIGAHPDDLEIIGAPGILACHGQAQEWFAGVVVCDGAGSPRSGAYADFSDLQMAECRREEQRRAAALGEYSLQLQLGYSSDDVKAGSQELVLTLTELLRCARPHTLYLHNPADAHATHRATLRASIEAMRRLDEDAAPARVLGVEVWRGLDWLPAQLRETLAIIDPGGLQARLLRCHDSQVSGGKRYDEAILARQRANATLVDSHGVDAAEACVLAMDLRPLVDDRELPVEDYLARCLAQFRDDLLER